MDIQTIGDIVKRTEAKRVAMESLGKEITREVLEDMQKDKEVGDK